jgi:hypothetical protein
MASPMMTTCAAPRDCQPVGKAKDRRQLPWRAPTWPRYSPRSNLLLRSLARKPSWHGAPVATAALFEALKALLKCLLGLDGVESSLQPFKANVYAFDDPADRFERLVDLFAKFGVGHGITIADGG